MTVDQALLARFAERARHEASGADQIRGAIEPLASGDATMLDERFAALGAAAIARGEVGVVVLAGGMATRFGGVVKAAVPVAGGKSFLAVKVADARRAAGPRVPVYAMTSAATDARIRQQIADEGLAGVECFEQQASLRLTPAGEIFLEHGEPSPYATGHGDLPWALRESGVLARFRAAGGKILYMSNVDNVAATLEPAVIGAHLASGAAITAEVVRKAPGDRGGAAARVDGRPQIVEAFRFPPGFDQDQLPLFNTNTFAFDAAALDRDFELTYFRVEKQVDGQTAIQFERLVGELTALLPSHFLEVPRARFLPVKDPEELDARRGDIESLLRARAIL